MEYIIIGVVTAFNFIVIYWKIKNGRLMDGILDLGAFLAINSLFNGGIGALTVGNIASCIISIYLFFFPIKLFKEEKEEDNIYNYKERYY